jgi:hypothetical protein
MLRRNGQSSMLQRQGCEVLQTQQRRPNSLFLLQQREMRRGLRGQFGHSLILGSRQIGSLIQGPLPRSRGSALK